MDKDHNYLIVIEHVDGQTLCQGSPSLNPHQKLWILHHVADALACVHAADLIHRDVKPDNVMLAGTFYEKPETPQNVHLIDFDIAAEVRTLLTRHGDDAVGTPRYMSPEILVSASQVANQRARDVFAFGVLGWELLAECHPYGDPPRADRCREYYKKLYEGGDTIRSLQGDVPKWAGEVGALLGRCLSQSAAERPAIGEVARVCKAEAECLAARRAEEERLARQAEEERLAARQAEEERLARQAAEKAEEERRAARRAEQERLARQAAEKAEEERRAARRAEQSYASGQTSPSFPDQYSSHSHQAHPFSATARFPGERVLPIVVLGGVAAVIVGEPASQQSPGCRALTNDRLREPEHPDVRRRHRWRRAQALVIPLLWRERLHSPRRQRHSVCGPLHNMPVRTKLCARFMS